MALDKRFIPIVPFAQQSHAKFFPKGPFVSVSLAQWAIESAFGEIVSGKNNFFGIKATPSQIAAGKATVRWTHETLDGVYRKMPQYFADYDDMAACFDAHAYLLTHPWYTDCMNAVTPQAYARALWRDHYATGEPGHPYDQTLIEVMDENSLYQFDVMMPLTGSSGVIPTPHA